MKKVGQFFFCCVVILGNFSGLSVPVQGSDESAKSLTTVKARQEKLAQLLTEREQAQAKDDRIAVVQLSNQIAELYLKLCEFDSALTESKGSLEVARSIAAGDRKLLIDTLILTARVHISRTENPSAVVVAQEALALSVDAGYRS